MLGTDFEIVSADQWRMLVRHFSFSEVNKRKKQPLELQRFDSESKPLLPLARSFEKIGLGIRTQIEFFYPRFSVVFVSACPEQLHPVNLTQKAKSTTLGLFEV
jgi:hypothetical protein